MAIGPFVSSLGGIFGKKPKIPAFPTAQMQNIAQQERAETQGLAGKIRPYADQRIGEYQQGIDTAKEDALSRGREAASSFLSEMDPLTSRMYQAQADQLKRGIFGQLPEATAAAREAGAAGGGLQRGAVQAQLAGIPVQAAAQYGEGLTTLGVQQLQAKQNALGKVYDADTQMGLRLLGVDENALVNALNIGNQADINEINVLLDEARNFANQQRGIATGQYSTQVEQSRQDAANRAALWDNIGTAIDTGLSTGASLFGIPGEQAELLTKLGQSSGLANLITRTKGAPIQPGMI